ncbi:MAG: hypothetical protein V2A79_08745 [Planctomycetota bacterium]
MPDGVQIVEETVEVEVVPLERRLCQAVQVIRRTEGLGFWDDVRNGVHLRRHAGSYEASDLILFLMACFASGSGDNIKGFAKETADSGPGLAALVGRNRWMGQSSVSRALSAVCDDSLQELVEVMRGMWPRASALQKLSALGHRDAFDQSWQVFHYDGSVVPVRQRQLPRGDDLPTPKRRSEVIAARGYPGRKRAEAIVQRTLTQEAHSTWWVTCSVEPGNGDAQAMATVGAGEAAAHTGDASQRPRAIFVADGGSGGWAPLRAAIEAGLYGLVRCSRYDWLDLSDVRKRLYDPGWFAVTDSRSGPLRSAKELGIWQDASGHLFRVIVSRFAVVEAQTERCGAGREIDGWHYELFLCDAPAEAWPAQETVTLYYDRCGQENRFSMLNRRHHLGRIFNFRPQGQALAILVALIVWNVEVLLGAESLGHWDEDHPDLGPTPRNDIPVSPPVPPTDPAAAAAETLDGADHSCEPEPTVASAITVEASCSACEPEATAKETLDGVESDESSSETSGRSAHSTIEEAISARMQDWLSHHPGWTAPGPTLVCPAGTPMTSSLIGSTDSSITIRFRAPASACRCCPSFGGCTTSVKPRHFRKDFHMRVPFEGVTKEDLARLAFNRRNTVFAPGSRTVVPNIKEAPHPQVSSFQTGRYACRMSRLSVGELLRLHDESSSGLRYGIEVQVASAVHALLPSAIAPTPAQRQRRRKTFAERLAWNDLPAGSTVRLLTIRPKQNTRLSNKNSELEAA